MAKRPRRTNTRVPSPVEGEGARDVSWLRGLALSLRMLARDARAGELRVLVVGLLIAVSLPCRGPACPLRQARLA